MAAATFGASQPVLMWPQSPLNSTIDAFTIGANSSAGPGFTMWSWLATIRVIFAWIAAAARLLSPPNGRKMSCPSMACNCR